MKVLFDTSLHVQFYVSNLNTHKDINNKILEYLTANIIKELFCDSRE